MSRERELLKEVLDYFEHANTFFDEFENVERLCSKIEAELKKTENQE